MDMITEVKPTRAQKYRDEVARGIAGWGIFTLIIGWALGILLFYMSIYTPFDARDLAEYGRLHLRDLNMGYVTSAIMVIVGAHIVKAYFAWSAEALRALGRMEDAINYLAYK